MPTKKKATEKVSEIRGERSNRGAFAMGISWGIAIVSLLAFGGLLVYVLIGGMEKDWGKVLGATINKNVNQGIVNNNVNAEPESPPPPEPVQPDATKLSAVTEADHIRGAEDAPVTLIEFSDFQCPFCARHQATLEQILTDYQGKVRLVYRHFPLTSIHAMAQKAAEAAECAGEQEKFWEMHDLLFKNQQILSDELFSKLAKDLKLDTKKFDECLSSGKYAAKIQANAQEATAAGVTGTPGTFVNNVLVKGAVPYEQFKLVIDQAIGGN